MTLDAGNLELVELDEAMLDDVLCCEPGVAHARGLYGHDPEQGVAWRVTATCGYVWLVCDARWRAVLVDGGVTCIPGCHKGHRVDTLNAVAI